jgi:hypothetical protein
MADFNGFQIGIGADVTVLEIQLQKAQNILKQFEAAAKKATDIGEINYLNTQIKGLNGTIDTLHQEMNKVGKPVGDASQSLINFSRIAQDAPYGIMGIANNLNPMVESFQRLAATEGGTKKALQAMISGLAGPAGIGVAIGVVSSLLVTYSKEISEFFKGASAELDNISKKVKELNEDIYKLIGVAQANRTIGLGLVDLIKTGNSTQQEESLKKLKALYSQDADIKKAKISDDKAYLVHLVNMASFNEGNIGKEKNATESLKFLYGEQKRLEGERNIKLKDAEGLEAIFGFAKAERVSNEKTRINIFYDPILAGVKTKIDAFKKLNNDLTKEITNVETPDTDKSKAVKKDPLKEATKNYEESGKRNVELFKEGIINQQSYFSESIKILEEYLNKLKNINTKDALIIIKKLTPKAIQDTGYDPELEGKFQDEMRNVGETKFQNTSNNAANIGSGSLFGMFDENTKGKINTTKNELTEFLKDVKEGFKQSNNEAEKFSNTMASGITNSLQGAFDALIKGENVFKALSDAVLKFAEDIAFAILKAEILAAIQGVIAVSSGGAGSAAGGTGFFDLLMGLMGSGQKHAAGGIVSTPQIGMIGEAGPEAIMPLSKLGSFLNTSFNAGSMSGGNSSNGGQFLLRGQDLLLSVNRAQKASNLKGQNISLA